MQRVAITNSLFKKAETANSNAALRFYGWLAHQHQDFFNQAFSLQGVEAENKRIPMHFATIPGAIPEK